MIFGIGNPARRDDGLGPKLIEQLQEIWLHRPNSSYDKTRDDSLSGNSARVLELDFEFRYQLNVEDALTIKDYDAIVFADATAEGDTKAALTEIEPANSMSFTTHEMSPASFLALCRELFGRLPRAYVLAIRGYEWDVGENLSEQAGKNLDRALVLLKNLLNDIRANR